MKIYKWWILFIIIYFSASSFLGSYQHCCCYQRYVPEAARFPEAARDNDNVESGARRDIKMSAAEPWRWSIIKTCACTSSCVTQFPFPQSWRHILVGFSLFWLPYIIGSDLALYGLQYSETGRYFVRHDSNWWSSESWEPAALFMLPRWRRLERVKWMGGGILLTATTKLQQYCHYLLRYDACRNRTENRHSQMLGWRG